MASARGITGMSTRKSYKFRIYPNKATAEKLQWVLDRCREVYNAALDERKSAHEIHVRRHPSYYDQETRKQLVTELPTCFDQINTLPEIKECRPEYQEIAAHVLQDVLRRLEKAYQRFFAHVKRGEKPGHPRFQGRNRYDSFTYPDTSGWKLDSPTRPPDKKGMVRVNLKLSKIGNVKLHLHRDMMGIVKTLTIKRVGEHWYAVFSCEIEQPEPLPISYEDVGIDLGITHFAALSNGEFVESPRHYHKAEKKLKKLQESLSRKKLRSHRRTKAMKAVAKAHRRVHNQRTDFAHKESRKLVNRYQIIVFEDLKTTNLMKRPKAKRDEATGEYLPNGASAKAGLNKSISDAGWGMFTKLVSVKAAWAGRIVVTVNPKYTSQICSKCGALHNKALDERWHSCECGCELDRDTNAAVNILSLGQKTLLGRKGPTLARE